MDTYKQEISGRETTDPLPPSYDEIRERDMDEEALTRPKNIVKSKNNSPEADGAHERMLPEEENKVTPNSNINVSDVKFTSNEKQNGDAKLDIGDLKSSFVGMGKEELMKYANDPFWVRLRWALFILFWLLWAGMLAGAILIIIAAPKCAPPEPRTWWEQGPLTEVETSISAEELKVIKNNGVQGIIVNWPLDAYKPINSSTEFTDFLQVAKDTDIPVIVDLKPGTSSVWFEDSEGKDDAFIDYYIWKDSKGQNASGNPIPPNKWVSPSDQSSWVYSEVRKQFYLAPFTEPHLNFRIPKVISEFSNVLTNFIKAGVKGIRLTGAPYLLVDESLTDEGISNNPSYSLGQYGFYTHTHTKNLNDLAPLISSWREIVKNLTDNGPFMLSEDVSSLEPYKINGTLMIDLPRHSQVFNRTISSGSQLKDDLDAAFGLLENNWPLWENKIHSGLEPDVADIITLLLPGVSLIPPKYAVEPELLTFRKSPSIMYGTAQRFEVANKTAFAFVRVTSGNPGYVVGVNPSQEQVVVDFPAETGGKVSEEVTVQYFSKNYNETNVEVKVKINGHSVNISPKSAIVLTYVPK